jgi:hypothetical protein
MSNSPVAIDVHAALALLRSIRSDIQDGSAIDLRPKRNGIVRWTLSHRERTLMLTCDTIVQAGVAIGAKLDPAAAIAQHHVLSTAPLYLDGSQGIESDYLRPMHYALAHKCFQYGVDIGSYVPDGASGMPASGAVEVTVETPAVRVPLSGRAPTVDDLSSPAPTDARRPDGQHTDHWILSDAERAKGFVRPVRRSYQHSVCGTITSMPQKIAETYAAQPGFYGQTFCCGCNTYLPVGRNGDFVWVNEFGVVTDEKVGT